MSLTKVNNRMIDGADFNVLDYGADPTGAADSTAALQAAINAAELYAGANIYGSAVIHFPNGRYKISSSLTIDQSNVTLLSGRRGATIEGTAAIDCLVITGTVSQTVQYVQVKGLRFGGATTTSFIKTSWTEYLNIEDCAFTGGTIGIEMSTTATEYDIKPKIENCVFYGTATGIKVGETRVADAIINQNYFQDNTVAALQAGYFDGCQITHNKVFYNPNLTSYASKGFNIFKIIYGKIEGNDIFETRGHGIRIGSPKSTSITGNTIVKSGAASGEAALSFFEYDPAVTVVGNTIYDNKIDRCYGYGILSEDTGNLEIAFNQIYACGFSGTYAASDSIHLIDSDNVKIRYNEMDGNSTARYYIYMDSSANIVIEDNAVSNHVNTDVFRVNSPTTRFMSEQRLLSVSSTSTITYADDGAIVDASGGAVTINLPSASTMTPGQEFFFIKSDSSGNAVTIDPSASQTINGATTYTLSAQYNKVTLISDGSNNFLIKST